MFPHPRRLTNNFTESPDGGLANQNERASISQEVRDESQRKTWSTLEVMSQISQSTDRVSTGAGLRRFHSKVSQVLHPLAFTHRFTELLDQVDLKKAEQLERYPVFEIQSIRKETKQREMNIS